MVKTADGTGVANASVRLVGFGHPELPPALAAALGEEGRVVIDCRSDERGVFKTELPHEGPFALSARAPNRDLGARHFPVMAGGFVTVEVRPASIVEGRVVDVAGAPVAGAHVVETSYSPWGVSLERWGMYCERTQTVTDEQGRFRLVLFDAAPDSLASGRSLHVWRKGSLLRRDRRVYRVNGQSLSGLELPLAPARLDVHLRSAASGEGLAAGSLLELGDEPRVVRADGEGRIAMDELRGGPVVAQAPGHAITGLTTPLLAAGELLAAGRAPAATLGPMDAGAVLRAHILGLDGTAARRRVLLASSDPAIQHHVAWSTTTDDAGRLVVDEARAGEALHAFADMDGHFVSLHARVASAQPTDLGEITPGGRALTGTVLAHDELRCAGALVMLQPILQPGPEEGRLTLGGGPTVLTRLTYTDHAGRFRFDHVPRQPHRAAIVAGTEGFHAWTIEPADGDLGTLRLPQVESAAGLVRMPDGSPAAHASVQYVLNLETSSPFGMLYLMGRTDEKGRFTFHGLPAHPSFTCWAMASRAGQGFMVSTSGSAAGNDAVTLTLQPHGGFY